MNILTDKCFDVTLQHWDANDDSRRRGWINVQPPMRMSGAELLMELAFLDTGDDCETRLDFHLVKHPRNTPTVMELRDLMMSALKKVKEI